MDTHQHSTNDSDSEEFFLGSPAEERDFGSAEGLKTVRWEINDPAEFKRLYAALDRGRTAFLMALRQARFAVEAGVSNMPLDEFEGLMFGPESGGIRGHYGQGFIEAFALIRPFVSTAH